MLISFFVILLASTGILDLMASFFVFVGLFMGIFAPGKKKNAKISWKLIGWIVFGISVLTIATVTTFAAYFTSTLFKIALAIIFGGVILGISLTVSKIRRWPWWAKLLLFIL